MLDIVLFVGLPYAAIIVFLVATVYRFKKGVEISSLSSQFIEESSFIWGSTPWHVGILIVLIGHIVAMIFPKIFINLSSTTTLIVESIGISFAIIALLGLSILLIRRIVNHRLHVLSSKMDYFVLLLILIQIITGILVAFNYRYGSLWAPQTTTVYFWSIFMLNPQVEIMAGMPLIIKTHVALAYVFIAVIPFSRLIHILTAPLQYFVRQSPQLVIFNKERRIHKNSDA